MRMERDEPVMRVATPDDADRVEALMKESVAAIFPHYYDARQVASSLRHIAEVDPMLLGDGTYFVLEAGNELVACGGWSRRHRLYTGSGESEDDGRLADPAREPAKVRAMFVRSDWTRRGLGCRIIQACEAAARREGFRLRSDVPARRLRPDLRRDDARAEARPAAEGPRALAPRPRFPQARGGVP